MIKKYVYELDITTGKHNVIYTFDLDNNKDICYRSRMSSNGFFHGSKKYNQKKEGFLYTSSNEDEYEIHKNSFNGRMFENVPIVQLNNLWEFYKKIGFDYKTKKYTN